MELDYIIAPPRIDRYMEIGSKIYDICLKYIAPEDIHVYSIDEVFIDLTSYLDFYRLLAKELASKMISDETRQQGNPAAVFHSISACFYL